MTDRVEAVVSDWSSRRPDLDPSPMLIVGRIQRLAVIWDGLLRPPFADAGLYPGDFDMLAALRRVDHPLTPGELARTMLVTAGAATKRIDRLVAAGLVTRAVSSDDGRSRLVAATAKGRRLADRLIAAHLRNEESLLEPLDPHEREALGQLLGRLVEHVEPDPE